jgi:predicted membrane protein
MSHSGKSSGFFWGVILILFGLLFMLDNFYILDIGDLISTLWPLILVAIGIKFLLDHRRHRNETEEFDFEESVNVQGQTSKTDGISESNVFGDINLIITSEKFHGGSVSNVFGDIKLDISKTKLQQGTTKVFINGVFGDVTVVTPKEIPLKTRISCVAGDIGVRGSKKEGIFPKWEQTEETYETNSTKLSLSVSIVFGSITIF